MDKKSGTGLFLIGLLVTAWLVYTSMNVKPVKQNSPEQTQEKKVETKNIDTVIAPPVASTPDSLLNTSKYGAMFSSLVAKNERIITIETDLIIAKISSKGGALRSYQLKNYKSWNGGPVEMVWEEGKEYAQENGELYLKFTSAEGKKIDIRELGFTFENLKSDSIRLTNTDSLTFKARIDIGKGRSIERDYRFFGNKYDFLTNYNFVNLESVVWPQASRFDLVWENGVRYQEQNSVDESSFAEASVASKASSEILDVTGWDPQEKALTGDIAHVTIKNKYFAVAMIPTGGFDGTVELRGRHFKSPYDAKGLEEHYKATYKLAYKGGVQSYPFRIFLGPLQYDLLKEYDLTSLANLGSGWTRWIVRPIGEFFMLPIFKFVHNFIPNWGVTIIIFSLLIKLLLYPLSIQQMRSSQKMALLGPVLAKMREKYPDDQKKQQQEQMKLYSDYGINPAGGCLPLILQMPILYALWALFSGSIDLRQAYFGLWMTDLSRPDVILHLPFTIPIVNLNQFTGLALLMGITMFIQQKMTVTDPRQKSMAYMMPIMFTLMFANFPAGLNLYYFMFNLLSISQQFYMNKLSPKKLTLEMIKKAPKKESWLQKKMREAQEIAESQGKNPRQHYSASKPPQIPTKKKK